MTNGQNIAQLLNRKGIISDADVAEAIKVIDDFTKPDYIPESSARFRASKVTNVRPSPGGYRCSCVTGHDVQSGPFYCGEPATLIADSSVEGVVGVVAVCKRHEEYLCNLEASS